MFFWMKLTYKSVDLTYKWVEHITWEGLIQSVEDHKWKLSLPCSSFSNESTCNAGDLGLIPGSGRSPGEGNDHPLQYSFLKNPIDRRTCQDSCQGITRVGLSDLGIKPPRENNWPPLKRRRLCQHSCNSFLFPVCWSTLQILDFLRFYQHVNQLFWISFSLHTNTHIYTYMCIHTYLCRHICTHTHTQPIFSFSGEPWLIY